MEKKEPIWLVDPSGHIVKQPPGDKDKPLKPGWRLATDADQHAAAALEAERQKAEAAKAADDMAALREEQRQKDAVVSSGGPLAE
jgi:hypothetical protein